MSFRNAAFVKPEYIDPLTDIAGDLGLDGAGDFGGVEKGPKQVVIDPINVVIDGRSLAIR